MVLYGVGLHSGARTGLILQPLPPGSGIHFIALPSGADIPAHLSHVVSGGFATTLGTDGVTVKTVEHFLAACHAFGVTNLLVKVQGEIPVMDGSAVEFCKIFLEAGIEDQGAPIPPVVIRREIVLGSPEPGKKNISVRPCDHLRISYHLSYPPPVGDEDYTFDLRSPEDFVREIAPARTFGFMRDIHELEKMGLGSGGRLNNFILIGEDGVLNTTLRFPKEFARHKILDILGNFYSDGPPLPRRNPGVAHGPHRKPGHAAGDRDGDGVKRSRQAAARSSQLADMPAPIFPSYQLPDAGCRWGAGR